MVLTHFGAGTHPVLRRAGLAGAAAAALLLAGGPAWATPTVSFAPTVDYVTPIPGGAGVSGSTTVAGDFTGDHKDDVVILDYYTFGDPLLMINNGNGTFSAANSRRIPVPNTSQIETVKAADFNGDGKLDLMIADNTNVWVYQGNGNGTFTRKFADTFVQNNQKDAVVGDVNSDGKLDFVIKGPTGVKTWLGNGDGTFGAGIVSNYPFGSTDIAISGVDLGDFNHDGVKDVVVVDAGTQTAYVMAGNGAGHFGAGPSVFLASGSGIVPGTVSVGDFNHDGYDDIASVLEFTDTQHSLAVALGKADGTFGAPAYFPAGVNPSTAAVADLNHDGNLDIVSSDTSGLQQVIDLGNGDGTFTVGATPRSNIGAQTPAIGDFNADGKPDIAVVGTGPTTFATMSVILNTTP